MFTAGVGTLIFQLITRRMVPRNMSIVAITLVFGIGGMVFNFGEFAMQGIGLSAIVAILLNIVLQERTE